MSIERDPRRQELTPSRRRALASGLALTAAVVAGCAPVSPARTSAETSATVENELACEPFAVYAQNRWAPLGAAVREEPDILSPKINPGFAPNEVIAVDEWVRTGTPAYPTNPEPWNSDIWYGLAYSDGWVSFAAVRAVPTSPDPTGGYGDGGRPAPTPAECETDAPR